ncbi:MAG: ubiquitin-conjugating enzyme E2 [Tepidisphaeraceae bacterium]|jgi:ubiquitin-protein ligase
MTPRLRRLVADQVHVSRVFESHPRIRIVGTEGEPPEKYTVEFQVRAMVPGAGDARIVGEVHRAEVFLSLDYPRRPPLCRMITPVFHPNIDPQKICIGDHWNAGQSLAELIVRIGEMLCFQSYNVKSPLNAQAAMWAETNQSQLPLERVDLAVNLE